MTRIVEELAARDHDVHVVTSLPWYRSHTVEEGWGGRLVRVEGTDWGSITRLHPFPAPDKSNLLRRAIGFVAFSLLAGVAGLSAGGWFRRASAVVTMSPPLTLGPVGWLVSRIRRAPYVFNVQDVFPDAAVTTGAITNERVIGVAEWLERLTYDLADVVTVLSDDLAANVRAKTRSPDAVQVIPNFVDTDAIVPLDRRTALRRELGLGPGPVVLYAGNVGLSQSLDLVVGAARRMPAVTFLVNGDGAARRSLEEEAAALANLRFNGYVEPDRLAELLATGDVHVVPLRTGLGTVSVPSKTYSILAAARPVVASIDAGTAVPVILADSGAGVSVPPDDLDAFVDALERMLDEPTEAAAMGARGREWVEREASPGAVGDAYDDLIRALGT